MSPSTRASTAAPDLRNHLTDGHDLLADEMAATLGANLVLQLDRAGPRPFQHADRVLHIERIAEAGIGIDHDRNVDDIPDRCRVLGDLGKVHEAETGKPQQRVGQARIR